MQIAMFHLMPWPFLPSDFLEKEESAWVTYSNAHFDADRGRELYERYLSDLVSAEALGFDIVCVNEHHQTAYGLMPSPNLVAMALVQRTNEIRIAVMGNALPLRDHPLRVVEEISMLDVMSGGRIINGLVRGIGPEYHTFGVNPAASEERFRESHDLMMAAWTRPGPFAWSGEHYPTRYVNPWPRPLQSPHPPTWIPTQGSTSTLRWVAEHDYTLFQTFASASQVADTSRRYRGFLAELGHEADPFKMGRSVPVYVGKDDESALEEVAPHVEYLYRELVHRPFQGFLPPGYVARDSYAHVLATRGAISAERPSAALLNERSQIIVGSAETVLRRLKETSADAGTGVLAANFQIGTLGEQQTRASVERFAEHVLPGLKEFVPDPLGRAAA